MCFSPLCPCLFKPDRADESENGGWRGPVGYLDNTPQDAVKISETLFSAFRIFTWYLLRVVKRIHALLKACLNWANEGVDAVVMHFLAITFDCMQLIVLTATPRSSISQSLSASLPLSSAFHLSHSESHKLLTLQFSQMLWSLPKSFILLRRHRALDGAQHSLHLNRNKTTKSCLCVPI